MEQKVAEVVAQIQYGTYVPDDKTTFSKLADIWVEQLNPKFAERRKECQKDMLKKHLIPKIGLLKIKDLKPYHLQDIINDLAKKGYATATMKKIKQLGARILETAYDHDMIPKNVFAKVKVPSIEPNKRRALTIEERDLLTRTWKGHQMGLGAMIMMCCGLRRGELLARKWEDINLHKRTLSVNKALTTVQNKAIVKEPKSKAGTREVPIPNILFEILKTTNKDNPIVCPSKDGKLMTSNSFQSAWKSYLNYLNSEAGGTAGKQKEKVIDNITAHMIRHTYATMLYDAGVDVKSAQQFLGHASLDMTLSIYTHLSKYKQNAAIESLNAHLDKLISSETLTINLLQSTQ